MPLTYAPDVSAAVDSFWATTFLSTRDLSAQIPINYVTHPGVYLTAACFSNGTYDDDPAGNCISNLLASQFRRFVLDVYWDAANNQFNLCPVGFPSSNGNATSSNSSSPTSNTASSSAARSTSVMQKRQIVSSGNASATTISSSSGITTSTTSAAPITTVSGVSGNPLLELGQYRCSQSLHLDSIISLFDSFFAQTSNTIEATVQYLVLNLHAAASLQNPGAPAPAPRNASLPGSTNLVGYQFQSTIPSEMYTPSELALDRSDLNTSWYAGSSAARAPTSGYFTTFLSDGGLSTNDGWPGEDWLLMTRAKRLLVSWGTIDPQMQNYNFSGDAGTIFGSGQVSMSQSITVNGIGEVNTGCFYSTSKFQLNQTNSSWATASTDFSGANVPQLVGNITTCGMSPVLNQSLASISPADNITFYQNFSYSAIWSWAPGEPKNISSPDADVDNSPNQFRCALLDPSAAYGGHWRVEDCSNSYHVACRVTDEPYQWVISSNTVSYLNGEDACTGNTSFSAPRTGLENTYLYNTILEHSKSAKRSSDVGSGVWVNFNSLHVPGCWVTTGSNGTCPYSQAADEVSQRDVLIPTIGAIIVLILTALTMFVKCNVNRRKSHARSKRVGDGWDYEGVPS